MKFKNSTDRYYLLFLFAAFIILIAGLGRYGLAETSEARYAEISREMFLSGDYLNPKLLGIFHFHKPPVTYYFISFGYRIFGVNEFAARFFLQVAIILQLLVVYRIADLLYNNKRIAFTAGLIYFSFPIVLISSRNLTTDAFLSTFILAAIYCWKVYGIKAKPGFLYLFYTLVGLALLTKGPVALVFVLTYIITNKLILKKGIKITAHHILGFLLCVIIGASWYVAVIIEHPKIWDYFISQQLAGRITGEAYSERSKPFWFYFPILLGLLLPWWLALLSHFKTRVNLSTHKHGETKTLIFSSIFLCMIFSIFSTKLILYILPGFCMPAIIIAVGLQKASKLARGIVNITYASLMALLFIGLVFFWFFKPDVANVSTLTLIVAALSVVTFVVVYYLIKNSKFYKPAVLAATFGGILVLISTSFMADNSALINSTREMIKFIEGVSPEENKTILVYDYLLTSIPFYTTNTPVTLKFSHSTTQRETQFENDGSYKKYLWDLHTQEDVDRLAVVSKRKSTFLLVRNRRDLDKDLLFVKKNFAFQKNYLKWTLYYNK